jgi:hypothetical protein
MDLGNPCAGSMDNQHSYKIRSKHSLKSWNRLRTRKVQGVKDSDKLSRLAHGEAVKAPGNMRVPGPKISIRLL